MIAFESETFKRELDHEGRVLTNETHAPVLKGTFAPPPTENVEQNLGLDIIWILSLVFLMSHIPSNSLVFSSC